MIIPFKPLTNFDSFYWSKDEDIPPFMGETVSFTYGDPVTVTRLNGPYQKTLVLP